MSEILVSIICNTYNHEKFARDALEGFIMQKTNFAYEILVHDDASTDSTADIIREYEAKYPELIKPIYQTENQYSKKVPITVAFQLPRVRGKYVAFCEGDDYWTDDRKLQKQVDALEAYPEVDICAHQAQRMSDGKMVGTFSRCQQDCIFSAEQVIVGGGGIVATASLMYRNTLIEQFKKIMALDYAWQIYGSLRGGMLYLADTMSVYRVAVSGSWTVRMRRDSEFRRNYSKRVEGMLQQLDIDTNGKYSAVIQEKIIRKRVADLLETGQYQQIYAKENRAGYKALPLKQKIKVSLYTVVPWLEKCWRNLKKKGS